MLRPSPNHGTQRLPNDDDDGHVLVCIAQRATRPDQVAPYTGEMRKWIFQTLLVRWRYGIFASGCQ